MIVDFDDIDFEQSYIKTPKSIIHDSITNPFYVSKTPVIPKKEFSRYDTYIMCSLSEIVDFKICEKNLDIEEFESIHEKYILIKCSPNILKNKYYLNNSVIYDTSNDFNNLLLDLFNHEKYVFESKSIIIIMMIDLHIRRINDILKLCAPDIDMKNIIEMIKINLYTYRDKYNPLRYKLIKKIKNTHESNYWTNPQNCNFTINDKYITRMFNYNGSNISNKLKLITSKNTKESEIVKYLTSTNIKENNYLKDIYRKQVYVDASSSLNSKNYYYFNDSGITKDEINTIFGKLNPELHKDIIINMFNTLLISKNCSHLVLNNDYILGIMQNIINEYYHLYRYLLGYSFFCLYMEESLSKKTATQTSRFVFEINTVNKLPVYPVIESNIHLNPYLSGLITSQKILSPSTNCMSYHMTDTFEENYGVCDIDEFTKRMNLFACRKNKNMFKDVDWSNTAISGSVIPACLQKRSQLIDLVKDSSTKDYTDEDYLRFYDTYYAESDLDIMCDNKTQQDFIASVKKIIDKITHNLSITYDDIVIQSKNSIYIAVHVDYLKHNEVELYRETNMSIEDINKNFKNEKIKNYFYRKYVELKELKNTEITQENIFYDCYKKTVPIDDMTIILVTHEIYASDSICVKHEDKTIMQINENVKYNVESEHFRSLEIFKIKDSFIKAVSRFHLPCVRAYYRDNNVYLVPSCVIAMQTGINIDYKYFAGIRNPIEIINKYRFRGFGIFLNDEEKQHLLYHNSKLGLIDIRNKTNIEKYLGFQDINSDVFKNKTYLHLYDDKLEPKLINSEEEFIEYMKKNKNYDEHSSIIKSLKLLTVNENGKLNTLNKWILDLFIN